MRGAILFLAVLTAATTTLVQAQTPTVRSFRPVSSSRVAIPVTPRPPMAPSVMPRMFPAARPPHCPPPPLQPPKPPLSVSIPKPDYNKRTMALIQQNIAIMAAMRAVERPRPCDPSWSAKKLARKGCPPAQFVPEPILEPATLAPEMIVATARETTFDFASGQN